MLCILQLQHEYMKSNKIIKLIHHIIYLIIKIINNKHLYN